MSKRRNKTIRAGAMCGMVYHRGFKAKKMQHQKEEKQWPYTKES